MKKLFAPVAGLTIAAAALMSASCKTSTDQAGGQAQTQEATTQNVQLLGAFSPDSAYRYIQEQVDFGPRVPGTEGHARCRQYIIDKLESFGADSILLQDAEVTAYNGDKLPITNIIAGFNTDNPRRVLVAAHWDSRPWADQDTDSELRQKPVIGANDGASGVAVMLEMARNFANKRPNVGVDFIFFDGEDYGDNSGFGDRQESWCLGSQYWADHLIPYNINNMPIYGILLDMVGGRDARFHYEMFSHDNAPTPTLKVWSEAERLGYDNVFVKSMGGAVTDDHIYMTRAGIPTTDVIETINNETSSFPPTWHTAHDDMKSIDKGTLKAVGETVLNVLYKEKAN